MQTELQRSMATLCKGVKPHKPEGCVPLTARPTIVIEKAHVACSFDFNAAAQAIAWGKSLLLLHDAWADSGAVISESGPRDRGSAVALSTVTDVAPWVACGTSNLGKVLFPSSVRSVAIAGDNDGPGRAAANRAVWTHAERGLRASAFFPSGAKDFNQVLMETAK